MPTTKTKAQPKTDTAPTAAEQYEKGRRIVPGEKPSTVFSAARPGRRAEPFFCGSQKVIADAVAEMITTSATEENLTRVIQTVIDHDWRRRFHEGVNEGSSARYAPTYPKRETRAAFLISWPSPERSGPSWRMANGRNPLTSWHASGDCP